MANVEAAARERARVSENILNVTDQVTSDFTSLKNELDEVGETSRLVCDSIDQIGQGNEENLSAVELQTNMTGEIQSLLNETNEITTEAVEVSGQMSDMLGQSLTDMVRLVTQAIETTEVGNQMKAAAERQQRSSDEAMNITDMIFSISGQTKKSTEQITNILKELAENAGDVSEKAASTVQMANAQKELVELVKGVINDSRECSLKLGDTLKVVNDDMLRIKDSNDEVVNSTSRLLATSEEFTASTQETIRISRNNMDKIEEAIDIMTDISGKLQDLAE